MNAILRNVIVVLGAIIVGGAVNMWLISISSSVVPLPEGVDPNDIESLKANIHLFEPINFLMPFLAHALGTLVAAFIAAKLVTEKQFYIALGIGGLFLIGGIMMVRTLPHPVWFALLDLGMAYFPMGWLGWKLSGSPQ